MAGGEGVELVEVEMEDIEGVVVDCERLFVIGELVEFWAGPVVRAYRTDSGEPAFVKEIHVLGWYGIKWWEALGVGTDECFGEVCLKTGRFKNKL